MSDQSKLAAALADRYQIERELGGGGMSRVWVATETALDRQVVIKVIAAELTEGASAERFAPAPAHGCSSRTMEGPSRSGPGMAAGCSIGPAEP